MSNITINATANATINITINGGAAEPVVQQPPVDAPEPDLQGFKDDRDSFTEDTRTRSSWITRISYLRPERLLVVSTESSVYSFEGVAAFEAHEFKHSESLGRYFNKHIKGRYA